MTEDQKFHFFREELAEIKRLLETGPPRRDDLVDADYVATRIGLSTRTVQEGKAGTNAIPRVYLKSEKGRKAGLLRFPRYAVDKFVADKAREAVADTTSERVLRLVKRRRRA